MSTDLGMPTLERGTGRSITTTDGIEYSTRGHYFKTTMTDAELAVAAESIDRPLSVIYQVTRRCNFDCDFCSETAQTKDPTLDQIAAIEANLAGVPRVFLSGGEPLIRRDFIEVVDIFKDHIIAVPTNATRGHFMASKLVGKVKLIHPIRKGNGLKLADSEFLSLEESAEVFASMKALASEHGWTPGLRMTTWTRETEGYSILVYPDGSTWSWPVYGGVAELGEQGGPEDKVAYLGDLKEEPITEIWRRYTFKLNHLRKYLGKSISVSDNGSGVIVNARHK